jgi:hypothetical protein
MVPEGSVPPCGPEEGPWAPVPFEKVALQNPPAGTALGQGCVELVKPPAEVRKIEPTAQA